MRKAFSTGPNTERTRIFKLMGKLIFGKVFASMFEGSMYGAGAHVFAVMSYVISYMQPDKDREEYVRLNPKALSDTIGEKEDRILAAIDFLCAPDEKTATPGHEGKRLILHSPYVYWVVNGRKYREIKDEQDRLAKAAARQQKCRDKKKEIVLTGKDAEAFEEAKDKSWHKRRKIARDTGKNEGATDAIKAGFEDVSNQDPILPPPPA